MHMVFRGINIRDHGLDGRVGIREQTCAVAAYGFETIDRMSKTEEVGVRLRNLRLQIRGIHSRSIGDIWHCGQNRASACHPAATDTGFAEEDVSQDADYGQQNHDYDPRHP